MRSPSRLALALLATTATAQVEVTQLYGEAPGDRFGWTSAFVGDVDGDGSSDLAIGAPFHDSNGPDSGRVYVYSGSTTQLIRTWDGIPNEPGFGQSIAGAGDLDGDGFADVLVGAALYWGDPWSSPPPALPAGYAQLISGADGCVLATFSGSPGGQNFGYAVAGGGDVDGDGVDDLLVGEPGGSNDKGYVFAFSGADYSKLRRDGRDFVRNFGHSVVFVGDLDDDGSDEYAVGGPRVHNSGGVGAKGHTFLVDGATGLDVWQAAPGPAFTQNGWSLARLGDVDGDGTTDLLVGGRNAGGGWLVFPSKPYIGVVSGADGSLLRSHEGAHNESAFGEDVTGVGDLNGDGVQEYASGQPGLEEIEGYWPVRVFDGATGDDIVSIDTPAGPGSFGNPATWVGWGFSLASGDANGDGLSDLVIGAASDDTSGTDAGLVSIQTLVRTPTVYCEAQVNSLGCTPAIYSTGTPSPIANNFRARATNVLNEKNGLLFWGIVPQQKPFGGGFKCVAAPTKRTPLQNSGGTPAGSDCSGAFAFHWSQPYLNSVGLAPGDEVFCQFWSRDPQAPGGTNLTDALAFFLEP